MKVYKEGYKNLGYLGYRLISQVMDPIFFVKGLVGYFWFFKNLFIYKIKFSGEKVNFKNLYPMVHDATSTTHIDAHYFYQQLWLFEKVFKSKPKKHIDIGSTYQMSGYLSKIVPTTFIDYRPIDTKLKNLTIEKGDILKLKYRSDSLESISCLHVLEHIGLGRYGDRLDASGTEKACKELKRVIKRKGLLYVSMPIGIEKICFNAHRIFPPKKIISFFKGLKLKNFSLVDDNGTFIENADYKKFSELNYGCGMFEFTKE